MLLPAPSGPITRIFFVCLDAICLEGSIKLLIRVGYFASSSFGTDASSLGFSIPWAVHPTLVMCASNSPSAASKQATL